MKHHAGTGLPYHGQNPLDCVRSCDRGMNLNLGLSSDIVSPFYYHRCRLCLDWLQMNMDYSPNIGFSKTTYAFFVFIGRYAVFML